MRNTIQALLLALAAIVILPTHASASSEESLKEAITSRVDQGLPMDLAVRHVLEENPDRVFEIQNVALSIIQSMPYGGACDDCGCSGGSALSEYPVIELEELERKDWLAEVVRRYEEAGEELTLPNFGEDNLFPFFYHFTAPLDSIRPHVGEDDPDPDAVKKMVEKINNEGIMEPLRIVLTSLGEGSHAVDARVLLAAAEQLNMPELPVRFSFSDCVICEERSDSAHYTVDEMRMRDKVGWVRDRFFEETEFVFVDKPYPGEYGFDYHFNPAVEELLGEFFTGEPDDERVDEWRERFTTGQVDRPIPVTFNFGAREVGFGDDRWEKEDVHAFLVVLQEMGVPRYPTLASFQDQVTCRSGMQRTTFSANELFPDKRVPTVANHFFEERTRIIFDEAGRQREARDGYPFGKNYPYHMMGLVDELYSYILPEDMPDEEDIEKKIKEIKEEGVLSPVYLRLIRSERSQEFMDESILAIVAAKRLEMKKLPVRVVYTNHPRRDGSVCEWLILRVIEGFNPPGEDKPKPYHTGTWMSPS